MNNIATTIAQSRKLVELGLGPKTADMCLEMEKGNWALNVGKKSAQVNRGLAIPAWSLSALLELMPKEIKKDDKQYNFHLETTHNLYYVSYYRYDIDGIRYLHTTEMNNCTIDAAYEMVCWLLENNLIKKGGKQ